MGLALLGGCAGKERPFAEEGPAAPVDTSVMPGASAGPSGSQPAPSAGGAAAEAAVTGGSGICDAEGNCECNAGGSGSCLPIALCADGSAACEATCPGCVIEGQCVAAGSSDAANPCQRCDPARSRTAWSSDDGASCDDGQFCTTADTCADGLCTGAARACEDGVACNGVSACDEALDTCSAAVNQCGAGTICDVATDTCASTCAGCSIDGVCLAPGAERVDNPCFVCDPSRSTTAYSASLGKSCGAAPGPCSLQDTCDAQGVCQPNHAPADTACGSPTSGPCDQPDRCDGAGACSTRTAPNAAPCDDGSFCTVGDQCQGGACVATGSRNCGAGLACNEAVDQCQCQGCVIGTQCFAPGAINGANPCDVCDPARSATAFSANLGVSCGAGPTECSAQDTCNAQRQCVPNDLPVGSPCSSSIGGECLGDGQCSDRQSGRMPVQPDDFQNGALGFVITGQPGDGAGNSVDGGGDVNGDGIEDLVIGADQAERQGVLTGIAYVVFGRRERAPISLAAVERGQGGFTIAGGAGRDFLGGDVAMAGDVNGDGRDDIIVGAEELGGGVTGGDGREGAAYVVFGKAETDAVSVAAIAAGEGGGFVINGVAQGDGLGRSVDGAGDVNADGLADVIVSTAGIGAGARVVFGKADASPVSAGTLRGGGFDVLGGDSGSSSFFVRAAGDVNGDGFSDVVVGEPDATVAALGEAGRAYVVFGRTSSSPVLLADIALEEPGGFAINAARSLDRVGSAVAGVGDLDGDGASDLLIGANGAESNGNRRAGKAYVVFGKANTAAVELSDIELGRGPGFVMDGVGAEDATGSAVAAAGDINGDGIGDLLVAAPTASRGGMAFSGTTYLVFGKADTERVSLLDLLSGGRGGFAIDIQSFGVAGGDFDADGFSDLVLGAQGVGPGGSVFVMLGQP